MYRTRLLVASLSVLLLAGCKNEAADLPDAESEMSAMPPPIVSTMIAQAAPVTVWDVMPGRVTALRVVDVRPQVSGLIERRLFEEGASVEQGQSLFEIDNATYLADVESAKATLLKAQVAQTQARNELERSQALLDGNNISRQSFDQVQSTLAQADADVAQAEAALKKSEISLAMATVTAPISGLAGAVQYGEGTLADPASTNPLVTIRQIDSVYIDIRQPASRLGQIRDMALSGTLQSAQGIPVEIMTGDQQQPITANVLFSDIAVEESTGNVRLRVVADNAEQRLLPGMFVRARVPRGIYTDVITVPQQSVVRDLGGSSSVYVVDAEGTAAPHQVSIGELVDGQYIVLTGLNTGDTFVVEGMDRLFGPGPVEAISWVAPGQEGDSAFSAE